MSSRKNNRGNESSRPVSANKPAANAPAKNSGRKSVWIVTAVAVAAVVVGVLIASGGGSQEVATLTADPAEAKYIGRYLPAGYVEPAVSEGGPVTADIPMAAIEAESSDTGLSISLSEVVSKRNVGFTYTKADGTPVALIAFVKPSGKLSVAVSFCPPCRGISHTMTTDGAMTCDACGTKRDAETGIGISGSCRLYPMDELPVTVSGDEITIDNAVLENWTEQPLDRQVG